jgi:cysteine desulfurase/selenocysteine lyase
MARFGVEGTVRASLALYNDKNDIDILVKGLLKAQRMLK